MSWTQNYYPSGVFDLNSNEIIIAKNNNYITINNAAKTKGIKLLNNGNNYEEFQNYKRKSYNINKRIITFVFLIVLVYFIFLNLYLYNK